MHVGTVETRNYDLKSGVTKQNYFGLESKSTLIATMIPNPFLLVNF